MVESGSVKVSSGSNQQTLKAGDTVVLSGDLTITQTGSGDAIVLAATIGDEVPAAPRFAGTITLQIFGCPAGTTVKSLPAAGATGDNPCASVLSGVELTLKTRGRQEPIAHRRLDREETGRRFPLDAAVR